MHLLIYLILFLFVLSLLAQELWEEEEEICCDSMHHRWISSPEEIVEDVGPNGAHERNQETSCDTTVRKNIRSHQQKEMKRRKNHEYLFHAILAPLFKFFLR